MSELTSNEDIEALINFAIEVFGNTTSAESFLNFYHPFYKVIPIAHAKTKTGLTEITEIIGGLQYGGVA
jgi:uncharacterized protein (DUF2384 family)